jgi:uncharacterized protein
VIFVDSSALLAVLDRDEERHAQAAHVWGELLKGDAALITTHYVLLETAAVAQRRIGVAAVRELHDQVAPALTITWVSEDLHTRGMGAVLSAARRKLSLVDCISFLTMHDNRADTAFAFDAHFEEQGFTVIPSGATSSPA